MVRIENLCKLYSQVVALYNLDLTFEKGKIYGLLGPNGSGKTTLMKLIAGLLKPTHGEIIINDEEGDNQKEIVVAYMPAENYLLSWMKVEDSINFYKDMFLDFDLNKATDLLRTMNLNPGTKIKNLSTGMLGRLKILLTISRNAHVYLLDEPLKGIDTFHSEKIIDLVIQNSNKDNLFIISSHRIKDIESILDELVVINKGLLVQKFNSEEIRNLDNISVYDKYKEVLINA